MRGLSRGGFILVSCGLAIGLGAWFFRFARNAPQHEALSHREVATRVMAEYLAGRYRGQAVLVISNPFTKKGGRNAQIYAFEEAGINGLQKGLGKTALKVVYPELRPEVVQNPASVPVDPKTTTPLSFLVAEHAYDKLAKENPECDLIVSLIGLPVNLGRVEIWRNPDRPKFALLLPDWRVVGNKEAVTRALKSGKIIAAVMNKPGAPPEETPLEGDYAAQFSKRFLLVTAETIDQLCQAYPQLF